MAAANTVCVIAEALARAVEPVELALRSPASFGSFMLQLGWRTNTHIPSVRDLGGIATELLQLAREGLNPGDAPRAIGLLAKFFDAVRNLGSATGLPDTIDAGEFASDFPQQLTDYVIATYLLQQRPLLGAVLLAGGVIVRSRKPPASKRPAYERLDIAWSSVGDLLHDALSTLRNAYGWGTPAFAQQSFVDNMVTLGEALGCDVSSHSIGARLQGVLSAGATSTTSLQAAHPRWRIFGDLEGPATVEVGVDLFVLPPTTSTQPGIAVSPYAAGLAGTTLDITDSLSILLKGDVDISRGVLVSMRPGQAVAVSSELLGESPATGGVFSATLQSRGESGSKTMVLGSEDGSRFEYGTLALTVGTRLASGPSFFAEAAMTDAAIVISPGADADGFIASLLPSELRVNADVAVGFDSMRGAYLGEGEGLVIEIPAHIRLGPLDIVSATIAVQAQGEAIPVALGATFKATIGPIAAEIDNVGLLVDLAFPGRGGNLGPVNAALRYKPPQGVGLAIDADVVRGGGFLSFDTANDEYAGAVFLEFHGGIAVTALGLVGTRLPGGRPGYSLIVVVTAEGFQPIPLGFGFMLTGIGGLLGVHRTINVEALQAAVRNQTLEGVLAPRDVVRNAPQFLSTLGVFFPAAPDHHFFGPMAEITWGTPPLLTIKLALLFEFGVRTRLVVLGRITAILPRREHDLVRLQMDVVGGIDFDRRQAFLDAALFDSRLVNRFPITGEMRLRMRWDDQPLFALAIGGVHPAYTPPPGLEQMQRAAIVFADSETLKLRSEAYLAITSNTVQFGARLDLFASASKFSIAGQAGYDVLIQFDPFHFIAALYASLQLKAGSRSLFKVTFEGELSGPRPLRVRGRATFEILWWDYSVTFNTTLVSGSPPPPPLPVDVVALLRDTLIKPASWSTALPGGGEALVALREGSTQEGIRVHPLGALTIKQNLLPLAVRITRYGNAPVTGGARQFRVTRVDVGGRTANSTPVLDHFAPAQYRDVSDDEKLSSASFEMLQAGVSIGADGPECGAAVTAPAEYEDIVIPAPTPPDDPARYTMDPSAIRRVGGGRRGRRGASYRAAAIPLAARRRVYRVVSKTNLAESEMAAEFRTRTEAQDAFATLARENRARLQIVAAWR